MRSRIAVVLAVVYAAFFLWYTNLSGPLTQEEIAHYVDLMTSRGRSAEDIARVRKFLESDTGDDFVMMNVIELRDEPGEAEEIEPGSTSAEVLDRYMSFMWPQLIRRASHPVVFGMAASEALDLWGIDGAETWTQAAFMRYRSRRDMMEIATNPEFRGSHVFKEAAMAKTIAFAADPWMSLGDPRFVLALIFGCVALAARRPAA